MKRFLWRAVGILFALPALCSLLENSALGHDPYEITTVAYARSNKLEILVDMEFRAGMLVSGIEATTKTGADPTAEFTARQQQLRESAGAFLHVVAEGHVLRPTQTNVTLEVENHVRFKLEFPPAGNRALTISVPGLSSIAEQGSYGVGLTVLDMVNEKVLGQCVLLADSEPVKFAAAAPTPQIAPAATPPKPVVPAINQPAPETAQPPMTNRVILARAETVVVLWPALLAAAAVGILVLAWLALKNKSPEAK